MSEDADPTLYPRVPHKKKLLPPGAGVGVVETPAYGPTLDGGGVSFEVTGAASDTAEGVD